jgi:hypothetical protein
LHGTIAMSKSEKIARISRKKIILERKKEAEIFLSLETEG